MGLSQQPWSLGFLAWFSLVPVLFFLEKQYPIKKTLFFSFLWGFIYHVTFLYWLSSNIGIDSIWLRFGTMLLVASFLSLNIMFSSHVDEISKYNYLPQRYCDKQLNGL